MYRGMERKEPMVTINVIQRTFHIGSNASRGTAFAIDRNNRQCLVTARHVVAGISSKDEIKIYHEQQWKSIAVRVVGICDDEVDVAVLSSEIQLAPSWPLEATAEGLTYGQQVYFLGFPFGFVGGLERLNRDFPAPFVKGGIYSATDETCSVIYIDGHNNPGFSGGPVVFVPSGRPSNEFRVAGVVASYPTQLQPIVDKSGAIITGKNDEPAAYTAENSGLVVAYEIQNATNLIDAFPIGFELPIGEES